MDKAHAAAVTRMQLYMETHLEEELTLTLLARQAGYSPWHSAKLFKEYTGDSPFDYLRKLRLSKAALILRDEPSRVLDVALDFVFASHEGFSRAFKRQFGLAPKKYQKTTPPIPLFTPYPAEGLYYLDQAGADPASVPSYQVSQLTFPSRKMLLLPGQTADNYFDYCREVSCDVWGLLISIKEALYEPVGMWLPDSLRTPEMSRYAQGVEVPADYAGTVPPGFAVLELPACELLMFQGAEFAENNFAAAITSLAAVVDQYDPTADGLVWADEIAPRIQLEPQGYRGYIEARPVRRLNN